MGPAGAAATPLVASDLPAYPARLREAIQALTPHVRQGPPPGAGLGQAIRSLLTLDDPESEFLQNELKDLHGQLKSLDDSLRQIETHPATEADLKAVTSALQKLDPIWEVLYPKEQRRVLELLIEVINVSRESVKVQFRADGIEQIVTELEPIGERNGRTGTE